MKTRNLITSIFILLCANVIILAQNNWKMANCPEDDFRGLAVGANNYLFSGTWHSGLFRSTDNGSKWNVLSSDNFDGAQIINFVYSNKTDDVYMGCENGLYRSTDNGDSWKILYYLSSTNCFVIGKNGKMLFGTEDDGIYYSDNDGKNWKKVESQHNFKYVTNLFLDSKGSIFLASDSKIYKSTDDGTTWQLYSSGDVNDKYIYCIKEINNGNLIASSVNGELFRTKTPDGNWEKIGTGLTSESITTIAVSNSNEIYIGVDGDGVFKSTNNGDSWIQFSTGLSDMAKNVHSLTINNSNQIVATTSWGIWTFGDNINPVINEIIYASDFNIYPNPITNNTVISFDCQIECFAELSVFDFLGNKVITLLKNNIDKGYYSIPWEISSINTGAYILHLKTGDLINSKIVVINK